MFAVTEFSNSIMGIEDDDTPYHAAYRECDANSGFSRSISISNYILMGQKLFERPSKSDYVSYEVEHFNYAKSTFIFYLPAIIGMIISKLTGLGTVMMYFLSRFLMLAVYSVIGYFAIRKIPTGKALLAAIMLLPTGLSRAACVSQDGLLHAVILFIFFLIMLEPDFGTGVVIVMTIIVLLFVSGVKMGFFVKIGILGLIGIAALVIIAPYRMQRIVSFLNPWSDPLGSGFQIIQSLYAIGPGGLLGLGFGNSVQKHFYLPEPQTDFIFSIISEEFGFMGAILISPNESTL